MTTSQRLSVAPVALLLLSAALGLFVTDADLSLGHWWVRSTAASVGWVTATVVVGCLASWLICSLSWNYAHGVRPSLSRLTHFLSALPALLMVAGLRSFAAELGWAAFILPLSAMLSLKLSISTLEVPEAWAVEAQAPLSRAELLPQLTTHLDVVPAFACRAVGISAALSLAGLGTAGPSWGNALAVGVDRGQEIAWGKATLALFGLLLLWWTLQQIVTGIQRHGKPLQPPSQ